MNVVQGTRDRMSIARAKTMQIGAGGAIAFSPSQISGILTWLKADSLSLNDADAVATWTAASGTNATQSVADNKPTFQTNELNALPIVRFDGTNDCMRCDFTYPGNHTLFIVTKRADATGSELFWEFGYSAGSGQYHTSGTGINAQVVLSTLTVTNWNIIVVHISGATATSWVNGGSSTSDTIGTPLTGTGQNMLGAKLDGNFPLNGDIAEVIIYNSALSTANINLVGTYLGTKYALTWTTAT